VRPLPAILLLLLAAPAAAAPEPIRVETEHYALLAETDRAEAEELGRVLEAAWPQLEAFFGAAPDLDGDERLPVRFFATKESFAAGLRADGIAPPASGGYYHPPNRTAWLWRQPTIYNTRCLLLHEVTHQFHFLARTGNRSLPQNWYVEGLAEHLGRHEWDGETPWHELVFLRPEPVVEVVVDPETKLTLDADLTNNRWREDRSHLASTSWAARVLVTVQSAMLGGRTLS